MDKKTAVIIPLVLIVLLGASCARDFKTDLLESYYSGPSLQILTPLNGSTNPGNVQVTASVRAGSGVRSVIITTENGQTVVDVPGLPQDYALAATLYYTSSGTKTITLEATDKLQKKATAAVDIAINGGMVVVTNAALSNTTDFYTNAPTLSVDGIYAFSGAGNAITNVRVNVRSGAQTADYTATIGSGAFHATVTLFSNSLNTLTVTGYGNNGINTYDTCQAGQDSIAPVVDGWVYPLQGQNDLPPMFTGELDVSDNMSGVRAMQFNMDGAYYGWYNTFWPVGQLTGKVYPAYNTSVLSVATHIASVMLYDYAGNSSGFFTNAFTVDPSTPAIVLDHPVYGYHTNTTSFTVNGRAFTGGVSFVSNLFISVNGAPLVPVTTFGTNASNWTYSAAFTANQTNSIFMVGISGTGRSNTMYSEVVIDTLPPDYTVDPPSGTVIFNKDYTNFTISISDNLSGLLDMWNSNSGICVSNTQSYHDFSTNQTWSETLVENFQLPGGGQLTNVVRLTDRAGNLRYVTNVCTFYPAIFVSATGNDMSGWGFAGLPYQTIQKGLDQANLLGISNVAVAQGIYNVNSMNGIKLHSGINLVGSLPASWVSLVPNISTTPSVIIGSGDYHGIYGVNITNALVYGFVITNFGVNLTMGGGIHLSNSIAGFVSNRIVGNRADAGGGLYAYQSAAYFRQVDFITNQSRLGSPVYAAGSVILLDQCGISWNTGNNPSVNNAALVFGASDVYVSNCTLDHNIMASAGLGMTLYATNSALSFVSNVLKFNNSSGNYYGLVTLDIQSRFIVSGNTFEGPPAGTNTRTAWTNALFLMQPLFINNLFLTNSWDVLFDNENGHRVTMSNYTELNNHSWIESDSESSNNRVQ